MDESSICAGIWEKKRSHTGTTSKRVVPAENLWMIPTSEPSSDEIHMEDKILIAAIDCVAAIGVTQEERTIRQRLSIDVELSTDTAHPAQSDSLKDAVDYARVAAAVAEV